MILQLNFFFLVLCILSSTVIQSAWTVEYTNCISAEGNPHPQRVFSIWH